MRPASLFLVFTIASVACDHDTTPTTVPADGKPAGFGQTSARISRSTPPALAGRTSGVVRDQATDAAQYTEAVAQAGALSDPLQGVNAGTAAPTMVIRTGQAFIEVDKLDPAILKVRQLAAQVGGYITNSSVSGGKDQIRQATLEIKVPAPKYEQALGTLSTIGKVETVNSQAQDVGEEFVDVTARVANARRLEERLIALLANRTGKLDEVLRVERELARVREEIERYEGRLRYLGTRVATSTLTITVHEPAPIIGNTPGENPIESAVRRAWRNFVALLAGTIASMGVLIPLGGLGWAGWIGYGRWKKFRTSPAI
jgi:uncharacterized protein DUF4349